MTDLPTEPQAAGSSDAAPGVSTSLAAPTAVASLPGSSAPKDSIRDVSQLLVTDWERRPVPAVKGTRENRFQVVIKQSVLNQLHRHGQSTQDIEVCGVLVGNVYHDDSGPWLYVEHAIEGNDAASRSTQVTFTAETWTHIQTVMDRDYPSLRVLGWYHTHPGFGIFLSDMDVFIQENFFPESWQIALVYDPKANEEGVFVWREGKPAIDLFLIEEDEKPERLTAIARQPKEIPKGSGGGDFSVLADRIQAIEKRQKWILFLLITVVILALAWPLVVSTYLPEMLKRSGQSPPPPSNVPDYNDPTQRPSRFTP